jgi:hypothetical protein
VIIFLNIIFNINILKWFKYKKIILNKKIIFLKYYFAQILNKINFFNEKAIDATPWKRKLKRKVRIEKRYFKAQRSVSLPGPLQTQCFPFFPSTQTVKFTFLLSFLPSFITKPFHISSFPSNFAKYFHFPISSSSSNLCSNTRYFLHLFLCIFLQFFEVTNYFWILILMPSYINLPLITECSRLVLKYKENFHWYKLLKACH